MDFAQGVMGLSNEAFRPVRGTPERESLLPAFVNAIHHSMLQEHLHKMNAAALRYIAQRLNAVTASGTEIPNVYMWMRDLMTLATTEALYGAKNPIRGRPDLIDDLW